jgi:hypothetical protein
MEVQRPSNDGEKKTCLLIGHDRCRFRKSQLERARDDMFSTLRRMLSGLHSNGHCRVNSGMFLLIHCIDRPADIPSLGNQRGPDDFTLYVIGAC